MLAPPARPSLAPLSRRTVLRGFGAAVALPWLQAMRAPGAGGPRARTARVAWFYVPNGVHMEDWTPGAGGFAYNLPHILEPLGPYRGKLNVLSGLTQDKARANGDGPGDHARAGAAFLTGVQPLKKDGAIGLGPSADQVLAAAIGERTRFRSLVLGCERGGNSGECDSGYSCAYSSNISWQSATTPAAKETNPRQVFDRLFRGGANAETIAARRERLVKRKSLLDYVNGEAKRLARTVGTADRARLDEYLSGVRELERRLDFGRDEVVDAVPDALRPVGAPSDYGEYVQVMGSLIALAFETDLTRVATFMLANEGSNRTFPQIGVNDGHHTLSHHGKEPAKLRAIRDINRYQMEQFAAVVQKFDAARDDGGNLLDASMLVYASAIGDGNRHNHDDLPCLQLGGKGLGIRGGRHLEFARNTPMNDLHLELMLRMGVEGVTLGDGRGPLAEL
ncbi:MAG TPA: DUF1552 domain-containing protein [Planctomycetota bacterium]